MYPFPFAEFRRLVGIELDVAVVAVEPGEEPVLALAAILAVPQFADHLFGQIV